ncbi:MAG: Gldg family protein [Pseudomonadota bacterium]
MVTDWLRRYAVLFGLLTLAALILAAIVALLAPPLVLSITLLLSLSGLTAVLWLGGGGLARLRGLNRRRAWARSNMAISLLAAGGIAVLVILLSARFPVQIDLTEAQRSQLTPQTSAVLSKLTEPVRAAAFFPDNAANRAARDAARAMLTSYRAATPLFEFELIDPEARPAEARRFGIEQYGVIGFEQGDNRRVVAAIDELAFTEAVVQITGQSRKTVCIVSGLDGRPLDSGRYGYARALQGLRRELLDQRIVDLGAREAPDEACAVVLIAGARRALTEPAEASLRQYLDRGGSMLLLADPGAPANVRQLAEPFGLVIGDGRVLDRSVHIGDDPGTPAVQAGRYPPSRPTTGLDTSFFPDAAPVQPASDLPEAFRDDWPQKPIVGPDLVLTPYLVTTPAGGVDLGGGPSQPGTTAFGALIIRSAASGNSAAQTRIAVIGDTDFADNTNAFSGGNGDLFLNTVSWLAETARLTDIRAKPYQYRRLVLDQSDRRLIDYLVLLVLPGLAVVAAGIAWRLRR